MPLHLCCQYNETSFEFIEYLVNIHVDAVYAKNHKGLIPLHKAAHFHASLEILQLLVKNNPNGPFEFDKKENLPLHYLFLGLLGPPPKDQLGFLLKCYPHALSVRNMDGFVPFSMVNRPQDR